MNKYISRGLWVVGCGGRGHFRTNQRNYADVLRDTLDTSESANLSEALKRSMEREASLEESVESVVGVNLNKKQKVQ